MEGGKVLLSVYYISLLSTMAARELHINHCTVHSGKDEGKAKLTDTLLSTQHSSLITRSHPGRERKKEREREKRFE